MQVATSVHNDELTVTEAYPPAENAFRDKFHVVVMGCDLGLMLAWHRGAFLQVDIPFPRRRGNEHISLRRAYQLIRESQRPTKWNTIDFIPSIPSPYLRGLVAPERS